MAKPSNGKVQVKRSKWIPAKVECHQRLINKEDENKLVDDLVNLIYTFAVNQQDPNQKDLSLKATDNYQEAM